MDGAVDGDTVIATLLGESQSALCILNAADGMNALDGAASSCILGDNTAYHSRS